MGTNHRLAGKKVLITGAARGIGLKCAQSMADHGAQVTLADIDLEAARREARHIGFDASAVLLDVTDEASWRCGIAEAEANMGGLNVLVNNAGICIPGTVEDLAIADWDRTMDVDLKSVFLGCRIALPVLARHKPGAIVNISSISGLVAGHNLAAYNAAKAGVHLLTKSVALHSARKGHDVRVNSVHPAFIDTAMIDELAGTGDGAATRARLARQIPLGRIGTVDDVAFAVIYLASDEARFITGAELKLDGGLSAQ